MTVPVLNILAITDLHFVGQAGRLSPHPERRSSLAQVLLRKAWLRLQHLGLRTDVVVLLGDLVDDGAAEGAVQDLEALAATVAGFGVPCLAIHGNHDGAGEVYERILGTRPGLHELGGVGLLVFNDAVGAGDVTTRAAEDLARVEAIARAQPDLPLVALQHNPLYPSIPAKYPYMLTNGEAVLDGYGRAGVVASLSGHYHAGQGPTVRDGVTYYTVPTLCESPFRFAHVRVEERAVTITEQALRLDTAEIADVHCHTEYAYCGTTVSAGGALELAEALGVAQVCLTEHTFQLYFDREEAWSFAWQTDLARVERAWRERRGRMDEYRRFVRPLRGPNVRLGLEVDLLADGRLLLAPEDRDGWDLLVGAIHTLPGFVKGVTDAAETQRLFLRETERLLESGIHVLAHPFRFFRRAGLPVPVDLYGDLAARLARHGVAAEINFHTNVPDPAFFSVCARRGVRIALGSDSHDLAEVGEFVPHLRVLEAAGIPRDAWSHVLLRVP